MSKDQRTEALAMIGFGILVLLAILASTGYLHS